MGHFSIWDDVSYGLVDVFTGRSEGPAFEGKVTSWMLDQAFLVDKNALVRFCVDPKQPDVLVVKATGNRAYGFTLRPQAKAKAKWAYSNREDNVHAPRLQL